MYWVVQLPCGIGEEPELIPGSAPDLPTPSPGIEPRLIVSVTIDQTSWHDRDSLNSLFECFYSVPSLEKKCNKAGIEQSTSGSMEHCFIH